MKAHPVSGFIAAVSSATLVTAALCCAACLQELPLGDKYINEAAGFLRVRNTSAMASYIFTALELRDADGKTVQSWDALGQDGQGLQKGETWTGDVDREGSFTLYCTVWNDDEQAAGCYEYGPVTIKLHEVTESKIIGEAFFTDSDEDGFSDSWEHAYGFNPANGDDGGPVYVSAAAQDDLGLGTALSPYKSLTKGLWKAKYGLYETTRTVWVVGVLTRDTEGTASTTASVVSITDTGPRGVTVIGDGTPAVIDAKKIAYTDGKRALYLGPGTKLTLKNITIENGYGYRGGGVHVNGAELILGQGAVIQKCYGEAGSLSGGGIYAENGASVIMESGSLIGVDSVNEEEVKEKANWGSTGVGVALLNGASLTMKSGSFIKGNLYRKSSAVEADMGSLITLEAGAEISGNADDPDEDFQAVTHGGGIRLIGGSKLLMKGGKIFGNTVIENSGGGGVYVGPQSVFEMQNGQIRENKAGSDSDTAGDGGGVYVDSGGVFLMSGGNIAKNTAKGRGGGVYLNGGSFAKTGGAVYGSDTPACQNTADTECGNALFAASLNPPNKDYSLPVSGTY
ncbi:MAG: hypothetical protein LBP32_01195 [Spirochaetaceae bacterium]|jgi:hypothetical protein|nr:hypothetical protein [Spirochaetaceae bacterium]